MNQSCWNSITLSVKSRRMMQDGISAICLHIGPTWTRPPLVFFPPANGFTSHLQRLAERVSTVQPAVLFELRIDGRPGSRSTDIPELVSRCLPFLLTLPRPAECVLVGQCFGAPCAFECALQLFRRTGSAPPVVMLDPFTPRLPRIDRARYLFWRAAQIFRECGFLPTLARTAKLLSRVVLGAAKTCRGDDADPLDQVVSRYRPTPYRGQLHLVVSNQLAPIYHSPAWSRSWSHLALLAIQTYVVPGTHLSMVEETSAGCVADVLRAILEAEQHRIEHGREILLGEPPEAP
jgi:thioesterase domain-containing protein